MAEQTKVKTLEKVVIRFSGDSGDGMQLTGTIFSNLSAVFGNEISTFPDYPAEVRAPQGTLSGVSGFQVHLGSRKIFTPGDKADVLVAMNPAALKVNVKHLKPNAIVLIDTDSFKKSDLDKALFTTDDPFTELGLTGVQVVAAPISTMVKDGLVEFGLDNKSALRCKNMFALGLVCWLFERPLEEAMHMLQNKFAKKPVIAQANIKALTDGYNYGNNIHASSTKTLFLAAFLLSSLFFLTYFSHIQESNICCASGLANLSSSCDMSRFINNVPSNKSNVD